MKEFYEKYSTMLKPDIKTLLLASVIFVFLSLSHYFLAEAGLYLDIPLGLYHPEDPICLGAADCITEWDWNVLSSLTSIVISYLLGSVIINWRDIK